MLVVVSVTVVISVLFVSDGNSSVELAVLLSLGVREGNVRVIGLLVVSDGVEKGVESVGFKQSGTGLCIVDPLESLEIRSQVIGMQSVKVAKSVPEVGSSVTGLDV